MRPEPVFAMAALMALGVWIVTAQPGLPDVRPGSRLVEMRLGNERGALEITPEPGGANTFRFLFRDGSHGPPLSEDELREALTEPVYSGLVNAEKKWVFQFFNITSWTSLAWIAIGLGGQLVFSARFLIQWLMSEKSGRSVIPVAFWWLSLFGGVALFAYFGWRQDIVGVLGQSSGLVIYARNIRLIYKNRPNGSL